MITFDRGGRHRLRLQPRHSPHQISAIWLSASRKELPSPETEPKAAQGEIVIRASDAASLRGRVKKITDNKTGESALEISGGTNGNEVAANPTHTDRGRKTRGASEFTLKVDPKNVGVLLRRKLDYQFPNQRAEVFIADVGTDKWQPAGAW